MEFVTILLSSVLALLSPVGFFVDKIAENSIRRQFQRVEQLQVRVDNPPTYQLLAGKVERVRIAGRGLWPTPDFRIAAVELETDPASVDIQRLRAGKGGPLASLRQPVQAGVRLVLTEQDINKLLQSPAVTNQLRSLGSRFLGDMGGQQIQSYEIVNPRVEFLPENRLRLQVELRQQAQTGSEQPSGDQKIALRVETGLGIVSGRQLQLVSPSVSINENTVPEFLIGAIAQNFVKELDLGKLEESGITARILQLKVNPEEMEIAAFVRVQPDRSAQKSQN